MGFVDNENTEELRVSEGKEGTGRNLQTRAQLPESRLTGFIQVAKQHKERPERWGDGEVRQHFLFNHEILHNLP